jgi:DivIVA domain-containing protein
MIDITPLDVRKKKGDFRKALRGYETAEVDGFLDLIAERLEELVRENATMRDRITHLSESLNAFRGREQAMNEALVSAQQLREGIRVQSERDADLTLREARAEKERLIDEARREVEKELDALHNARMKRSRFLRSYRAFLEGQLAEISIEVERSPPSSIDAPLEVETDAIG